MIRCSLAIGLLAFLGLPSLASGGAFDNSLWLGTDNTVNRPVLNTDRAGHELRRVNGTEASGIAIDPVANRIYFGNSELQISSRDLADPATVLATITPTGTFGEDLAFDGTSLWRSDVNSARIQKIDPADGSVLFDFDPGFAPLGVAWDGSHLWVSEFVANGLVKQFDPSGNPTGSQFPAPLGGDVAGGLAYDPTDGTLWIGTTGQVVHSSTAGALLGSFNVPTLDGRFVDGLEFEGVPQQFNNSLWLGTDNTVNRPVLNTDREGHELRRVDDTEASGIAIDPAANRIYFGTSELQVTSRSLTDPATVLSTITPSGTFGEDLAFDGTSLWRADINSARIQKIDPADGSVLFDFDPGFAPLGVAWDGSHLWVSEFVANGLVKQFDPSGNPTGSQFPAPLGGDVAGGLAYDPTDGTLWIGTTGQVVHSSTAGALLGSFNVPTLDGRFVDGLEFEGVPSLVGVPEAPRGSGAALALSAAPNPFKRSVNVTLQLSKAAAITLEVFDVRGTRIVSLANGRFAAGNHVFRWDARDAQGRKQSAGVYWVKATADGRQATRSVMVLK